VKKAVFYLLLIFAGLAPSVTAVARADKKPAQTKSEHDSSKSRKAYLKQQKKQQKKEKKQQKQSLKNYKKLNDTSH
jgi:hypothetical protein